MEEFNIAEVLRYAPKGLKLYSPVLGEVELSEVTQGTYPIRVKRLDKYYNFTEHGRYFDDKGECLLFPSKDYRTWDNWQSVIFPQSVGCVCVNIGTLKSTMFICTPTGPVFDDNSSSTWDSLIDMGGSYLKSSRYATPEEVKQFFDTLKANGYEWNGKELIKTTPISSFKVGNWVVKKDGSPFSDGSSCAKITNITSDGQYWFTIGTWLDADEIRLWTIKDAKPGDILATGNKNIFIFKSIIHHTVYDYCGLYYGAFTESCSSCSSVNGTSAKQLPTDYVPVTQEQRDLLFEKMREAGYTWDAENRKLIKLQSDKFDVSTLHPFDKVLVRDYKTSRWGVGLFAYYKEGVSRPFWCNTASWGQCVPYNDDTKHLIGTMNDAPEYYKVWE